jgi:hypothetical protein
MYQITFVDGTEFTGGEPEQSMWDMLPNKLIKSIVYWLNEDTKFSFNDFEEYNHCVERVKGVNTGLEIVSKAIIMGRVGQRVYQVIFDLKRGTVYQTVIPWGQEYSSQEQTNGSGAFIGWVNGKPLSGWRQGILNSEFGPKLKRL